MVDVKDGGDWRDQNWNVTAKGQGGKEEAVFMVTKSEHGSSLPFYGS